MAGNGGWSRYFDDPITLPRGRALVTLRDAATYITGLPSYNGRLSGGRTSEDDPVPIVLLHRRHTGKQRLTTPLGGAPASLTPKPWNYLLPITYLFRSGAIAMREFAEDNNFQFKFQFSFIMKAIRGLILGSTAGLVAMGGAQAADFPVKAKAVEYVRICSLYGAGFYYIPGTDTCIKLGGYVRADAALGTNSVYGLANLNPGVVTTD